MQQKSANILSGLRPRAQLARVFCEMRFLVFRFTRIGVRVPKLFSVIGKLSALRVEVLRVIFVLQ